MRASIDLEASVFALAAIVVQAAGEDDLGPEWKGVRNHIAAVVDSHLSMCSNGYVNSTIDVEDALILSHLSLAAAEVCWAHGALGQAMGEGLMALNEGMLRAVEICELNAV